MFEFSWEFHVLFRRLYKWALSKKLAFTGGCDFVTRPRFDVGAEGYFIFT